MNSDNEMPKVKLKDFVGKKGFWLYDEERLSQLRFINEKRITDIIEMIHQKCYLVALNELLCLKQEIDKELKNG